MHGADGAGSGVGDAPEVLGADHDFGAAAIAAARGAPAGCVAGVSMCWVSVLAVSQSGVEGAEVGVTLRSPGVVAPADVEPSPMTNAFLEALPASAACSSRALFASSVVRGGPIARMAVSLPPRSRLGPPTREQSQNGYGQHVYMYVRVYK